MASLTQHSVGAYCLIRSKKSFININTFSATPTLNAKGHRASTATSFHLSFNIKKTASISNVNGYKRKYDQWRLFGSDDGSCGIAPMPAPPSVLELAKDFYRAINSKDINQLEPLLADDCQYQDLVFYVPFEGKKEGVIPFFAKLMDAMGPNVHFVIDNATEGNKLTASSGKIKLYPSPRVAHSSNTKNLKDVSCLGTLAIGTYTVPIARKMGQISVPFGSFSSSGITYWKATGMAEMPFKPGDIVLKFLKSASTFFDLYPMAAEALLKSHETEPHEGLGSFLDNLLGKH